MKRLAVVLGVLVSAVFVGVAGATDPAISRVPLPDLPLAQISPVLVPGTPVADSPSVVGVAGSTSALVSPPTTVAPPAPVVNVAPPTSVVTTTTEPTAVPGPQPYTPGTTITVQACSVTYYIYNPDQGVLPITYQGNGTECQAIYSQYTALQGMQSPTDPAGWIVQGVDSVVVTTSQETS